MYCKSVFFFFFYETDGGAGRADQRFRKVGIPYSKRNIEGRAKLGPSGGVYRAEFAHHHKQTEQTRVCAQTNTVSDVLYTRRFENFFP